MKLLLDIGNTHTTAALSTRGRVGKVLEFSTDKWPTPRILQKIIGKHKLTDTACCSVVPAATKLAKALCPAPFSTLTHANCGIDLRYPKPATIGPDRLANARAALDEFGGRFWSWISVRLSRLILSMVQALTSEASLLQGSRP